MRAINNPELLRYVRSELRSSRVAVITLGTFSGAVLMALFIFVNTDARQFQWQDYWRNVYSAIFVATSIILVLWSLLNVSQSVVTERTQRTFDFWRTTRLSALELALGKLFGAPLPAWLVFVTALPILLFSGAIAGFPISAILGSYVMVAVFSVALSAIALCASARAQDARRANIMMLIIVLALLPATNQSLRAGGQSLAVSAWSAVTPVAGISTWLQGETLRVMLFGFTVPSLVVTLALSFAVIAWCLVALVRCIKFEPDQISLFSPAQVVGVSASVLLFVYAAFRPLGETMLGRNYNLEDLSISQLTLEGLIATGVSAALACLYFTINATLLTRDNLRHQLRQATPLQVLSRSIAPWLGTGTLGLFAALLALKGYSGSFAGAAPHWVGLIGMYLSIMAYAVRDGLFLQWMISQRVKAPVLKGAVLIGCYYLTCFTVAAVLAGPEQMGQMLRWLVPAVVNPGQPVASPAWLVIAALLPPLATAGLIAAGIFRKMQRTTQTAGLLARV